MEIQEQATNPERERESYEKVDALVVLGRNFQPGFDQEALAKQRFHLSPGSRINTLAAGMLYKAGLCDKIIFSTGHTAGSNLPSEAEAMKEHLLRIFKDIPEEDIILENISVDTYSNAKEVKKIVSRHPEFQRLGLLSDTSHLERAIDLFEDEGMSAEAFDSHEILGDIRPSFIENYLNSELYAKTEKQDRTAQKVQTLPFASPIFHQLTKRILRNPNKPNKYIDASSS